MNILEQIDQLAGIIIKEEHQDDSEQIEKILNKLNQNQRWKILIDNQSTLYPMLLAITISITKNKNSYMVDYPNGISIEEFCQLIGFVLGSDISFSQIRKMYQWSCKMLQVKHDATLLYYQHKIMADERLLSFLNGENEVDIRLLNDHIDLLEPSSKQIYVGKKPYHEIENVLLSEKGILQVAGPDGCGKKFLLQCVCKNLKIPMISVDYSRIFTREKGELIQIGRAVAREAIFQKAGICFFHINHKTCPDKEDLQIFEDCFLHRLHRYSYPVCVCTDEEMELTADLDLFVIKVKMSSLTRQERILLWTGLTEDYGISERGDWVEAGTKYILSAKEIEKAVKRLSVLKSEKVNITSLDVAEACMDVLPPPNQGSIKKIHVNYVLDDLKLPPQQKQTLENICAHLRWRHRVYDEWNMESKFAYGKNVSALFVGPPGTGKTMAVHVLSDMMELPLYRIDLSQVVDKYIGETEKRLEQIFNIAEKSNSVLFFDEADSIFGKRSEVNDAKDKYANTEVSYILQRIEQYEGIVILATNYKKNIDRAFMRRMRYLVEFSMPGPDLRKEIWMSSFSKEIPLNNIDFNYLSKQFELSGGAIKNIVLNASFLAADEGISVCMKHILDCVKIENAKMGISMIDKDFGAYWTLF